MRMHGLKGPILARVDSVRRHGAPAQGTPLPALSHTEDRLWGKDRRPTTSSGERQLSMNQLPALNSALLLSDFDGASQLL